MLFSSLLSFLPSANIFFFLTNTSNLSPRVQHRDSPSVSRRAEFAPGAPHRARRRQAGMRGGRRGGSLADPPQQSRKSPPNDQRYWTSTKEADNPHQGEIPAPARRWQQQMAPAPSSEAAPARRPRGSAPFAPRLGGRTNAVFSGFGGWKVWLSSPGGKRLRHRAAAAHRKAGGKGSKSYFCSRVKKHLGTLLGKEFS